MTGDFKKLSTILIVVVATLAFVLVIPVDPSNAEESTINTIYDSLTEKQKNGYDALDIAVKNNTDSSKIDYLSISDGRIVREAYAYDHPEVFWFYDNFILLVYTEEGKCSHFEYKPTIAPIQIDSMKKEIQSTLTSLEVNAEDPDYKKLLTIHDWLCKHITYTDGTEHEGDIYGAIVEAKCVCQGYTMAFTYLCHLYGFRCVGVSGYTYQSSTIGHAWNLVFGESNWYFVDVTWDDNGRYPERDYFMVGSQTKINGRIFATEDHMADSLYGITPSETKFDLPTEYSTLTWIIIAVIAAGVAIYIVMKIRASNKRKQLYTEEFVITNNGGFYNYCPACGTKIDDSYDFCPQCGKIIKKEPNDQESQEMN